MWFVKCINVLVTQPNEVIPWYIKTKMDMYKQFYHEYDLSLPFLSLSPHPPPLCYLWLTRSTTHLDFPQFFTFLKLCGKEKKKEKEKEKRNQYMFWGGIICDGCFSCTSLVIIKI